MSARETYPRRLIEVDLPIKRISIHARREKSIRHGHISTLHIWWARRPLAACRAVICAALWPDPVAPQCPQAFIGMAREQMLSWAPFERQKLLSEESRKRFEKARKNPALFEDVAELRGALLDFIADFANWDNSTVREYLDTCRALTQAAHEALGGAPGTRPLVVDPFAGGGSIPLEALRVGADAYASDLNPVPALLNKVILEYVPKYGQRLADEIRKWGEWIKREAEMELAAFYPKDANGAMPIAYLWARTIQCEGPSCGAEVPLIRSLWLAKKAHRSVALNLLPNPKAKRVDFRIIIKQPDGWVDEANRKIKIHDPQFGGTVKRGSATCPCCGYTTPVARVRAQFKARHGGADDARFFCVISMRATERGRFYQLPTAKDLQAAHNARRELASRVKLDAGPLSLVPNESTAGYESFVNRGPIYGMLSWADYFTSRQALSLATITKLVCEVGLRVATASDQQFADAVQTCLALALDRQVDFTSSLASWWNGGEKIQHTFARQALAFVWDFAEGNPWSDSTGCWAGAYEWGALVCEHVHRSVAHSGHSQLASATSHPLPNDSAAAIITDPPYYYSVQYADLSDFFYVWLKRSVPNVHASLFPSNESEKADEIIVQSPGQQFAPDGKNNAFFEKRMREAMSEARRVLAPSGIGLVVFAHTSTAGWEAQLQAMLDADWIITASWPIDTEMATRVIALGRSVLASSVHLVCRPRESRRGSIRLDDVGDWRDVLQELPRRIHEWMPRLAEEGVVGADAIFACLGPSLEVFSRYSRVEKASGETVSLKEYLEQVWAAVSKEALTMIFTGADATGFEEDARLTAMWLWTLSTAASNGNVVASTAEDEEPGGDGGEENENANANANAKNKAGGFVLEYDAARKIAQGLGAHLEQLASLIEVKGATARLLPVAERTRSLFQKGEVAALVGHGKAKKKSAQLSLGFVADLEEAEASAGWGETGAPHKGETVLDRVHQAMILFGAGRGEALKRFLVDDGAGHDDRFWRLAQAFSALYPSSTDEKRWIDGVLARKKSLGF